MWFYNYQNLSFWLSLYGIWVFRMIINNLFNVQFVQMSKKKISAWPISFFFILSLSFLSYKRGFTVNFFSFFLPLHFMMMMIYSFFIEWDKSPSPIWKKTNCVHEFFLFRIYFLQRPIRISLSLRSVCQLNCKRTKKNFFLYIIKCIHITLTIDRSFRSIHIYGTSMW